MFSENEKVFARKQFWYKEYSTLAKEQMKTDLRHILAKNSKSKAFQDIQELNYSEDEIKNFFSRMGDALSQITQFDNCSLIFR